jgi:Family of unknown function (DUF6236)
MFSKALYYPHLHLPDNAWLRRAILYWDEVNPIVPDSLGARLDKDEVFQMLRAEGLSRQMLPEDAVDRAPYYEVIGDFHALISAANYLASLPPPDRRVYDTRIYRDKVASELGGELQKLRLAQGPDVEGWLHFETRTGALYMGYLAAAIARSFGLEPLTDKRGWQDALLDSQLEPNDREQAFASFVLEGLIPAPRADVAVADIVAFRRKHEEELLRFRRAVRAMFESLKDVTDDVEAARKLDGVKDEVREQSLALNRKLGDNRIETLYSTLEVSAPTKAGLVALVSLPIGAAVGAAGAVLKIGRQLLNGRIRGNSLIAESPYAYVYRIERELAGH